MIAPSFDDFLKIIRRKLWLSAAMDAFALGGGDAFCLPLTDVVPFGLGNITEDLQDQISDEGAGQILFPSAGVEQWHIQHDDIYSFFFGDDLPLLQDLFVISAQAVDGMQIEDICFSFFIIRR